MLVGMFGCSDRPDEQPLDVPQTVELDAEETLDSGAVVPQEDVPTVPGPCDGLDELASCDDGNTCTLDDRCEAGFCVGQGTLDCGDSDGCNNNYCDPLTGCATLAAVDGDSCGLSCHMQARCIGGVCSPVAGTEVACRASVDPCVESVRCEPETGECTGLLYKLACPDGFLCLDDEGTLGCVEAHTTQCRPCLNDTACFEPDFPSRHNRCLGLGAAGSFCAADCSVDSCPLGYTCTQTPIEGGDVAQVCLKDEGLCECRPAWANLALVTTCAVANEHGFCQGGRGCSTQGLTDCDAPVPAPDVCDGKDNDCDGPTDEDIDCGPPGGCCLATGGCAMSSQNACLGTGGTFAGVNVTCGETACGGIQTKGACCKAGGACTHLAVGVCKALNGVYKGDASMCAITDCGAPIESGACCAYDGTCSSESAVDCVLSGGTYQGGDSNCLTHTCVQLGACCVDDAACGVTTQADCSVANGQFVFGKDCASGPCVLQEGQGACCLSDGGCVVSGAGFCSDVSGSLLEGEPCIGQCPGPPNGACCLVDGCAQVDEVTCADIAGQWSGLDTDCVTGCAETSGACCVSAGCFDLKPLECDGVGGAFVGDGAKCPEACAD